MGDAGFDEQILANQRSKYRNLNEVYDLTKEIEKAFFSGDETALDMLFDMRQKKMELCARCDSMNLELLEQLDDPQKEHYRALIVTKDAEDPPEPVDESEETIYNVTKRIRTQMLKTLEYDRRFGEELMRG